MTVGVRTEDRTPGGDSSATGDERPRAEPALTWDLAELFEDDASFRTAKRETERFLGRLTRHRGHLGESPGRLASALDEIFATAKATRRLHAFASMRSDSDTRVAGFHADRQESEILLTSFARSTAFLVPEILAIPPAWLERALREEPALAPFNRYLSNLLRQREHHLSEPEERILAEAGLITGGPSALFALLHNAEIPRPEVVLSTGVRVRLTPSAYALHRSSPVPADRRTVMEAYLEPYVAFQRTLGQNLFETVKTHIFRARARRYPSCLAAALDPDNVPERLYRGLIDHARDLLPLLHRYLRLRARALGLPRAAYSDLHAPLAEAPARRYGVQEALGVVRDALAPLGTEYVDVLARAVGERWIDWYPVPGKRAGAYATGAAYDVHPFVLLNFNGDHDGVSTLAHELGHAVHSFLSNRAQPYARADYSILAAEVASTFNEILLGDHLLRHSTSAEERRFLAARWLDSLRATFFRQTLFAEFELLIHERAEGGEALTGDLLSEAYLELLQRYHGHGAGGVDIDPRYGIEWAAVPHFHYDFYVYQYATGIVASIALAEAVLAGDSLATRRVLDFLRSGGSDDPLALLRQAGVDLEAREPYDITTRAMARHLDLLEGLIDGGAPAGGARES